MADVQVVPKPKQPGPERRQTAATSAREANANSRVVERGPPSSGRYLRYSHRMQYDTILGKGAFKTVYKGFDEREGIEVAWNQVRSRDFMNEGQKLTQEISVLKNMKHKNVMFFYDSWVDEENATVNFITELFTSGTLREYRQKHKNLNKNALKRWGWQILQGLVYLHGHTPPIIHRDLKCDNIFVNGSAGVVKIGDLGLATLLRGSTAPQSCLGTPEFMAPELYEERYNEKVDVYGFGMCMLELATMQYPYKECVNAAQIYKRVTQGKYPDGLKLVEDDELREFIQLCISHTPDARPDTRKLLKHSFFEGCRGKNGEVHKLDVDPPRDLSTLLGAGSDESGSLSSSSHHSDVNGLVAPAVAFGGASTHGSSSPPPAGSSLGTSPPLANGGLAAGGAFGENSPALASTPERRSPTAADGTPHPSMDQVVVRAEAQNSTDLSSRLVSMNIGNLPQRDGERCNIEFSFAVGVDNVKDIIGEMLEELNLDLQAVDAGLIESKIDLELHRAQLAAAGTSSTSQPSTPADAHVAHGRWPTPSGEVLPFLQQQDSSAFESAQGTHYSLSNGSRDDSHADSDRAHVVRSWRGSDNGAAPATSPHVDPPRLVAEGSNAAEQASHASYAAAVAPRGPPEAQAPSGRLPAEAAPPLHEPLATAAAYTALRTPVHPQTGPQAQSQVQAPVQHALMPSSNTASPALASHPRHDIGATASPPAFELESSKRQGNDGGGETGGANGGLETFKQVRRRLEEALRRPEVRKASRADLRTIPEPPAASSGFPVARQA